MTTNILLWIILGSVPIVFEIYTVLRGDLEPLTPIVVKYVPWPVTMLFLSWLIVHFGIRYGIWAKIKWLVGWLLGLVFG